MSKAKVEKLGCTCYVVRIRNKFPSLYLEIVSSALAICLSTRFLIDSKV